MTNRKRTSKRVSAVSAAIILAIAMQATCVVAETYGPFLTCHDDPTSTITITWLVGEAEPARDAIWRSGKAGFGYGDDDDATQLRGMRNRFTRVYLRKNFQLSKDFQSQEATLHIRYDDAFIAYLNGVEIARRGVGSGRGAAAKDIAIHEAGTESEIIPIEKWRQLARKGENVLAIEGHNVNPASSDFTLDPFVTESTNGEPKPIIARGAKWLYFAGGDPPAGWASPDFLIPDTKKKLRDQRDSKPDAKRVQPTKVRWRKLGESQWLEATGQSRPFADAHFLVHNVRLANLTSATDYEFMIVQDEQPEGEGGFETTRANTIPLRFRTAPATIDEDFRFVTGGDMGIGDTARAITSQAASSDPAFALLGGDLAYANGRDLKKWLQWIKNWHEMARTTDGRLIPMIIVIGNHETGSDLPAEKAERLQTHPKAKFFYSLFTFPDGKTNYAVDFGNYLSIACLDSDHTQRVADQTDWLSNALEQRKGQQYRFACYHRPTYGTAKAPNMNIRKHWVPLFEQHQIDAVFENDHHTYKRTHLIYEDKIDDERGILYLGDGAWGVKTREVPRQFDQQWWHLKKAESRNHFWLITLRPAGHPKYEAIDRDGNVFDTYEDKR